jgi:hypothetical protein
LYRYTEGMLVTTATTTITSGGGERWWRRALKPLKGVASLLAPHTRVTTLMLWWGPCTS